MIDENVNYKLFSLVVAFRQGSRLGFEVGQEPVPEVIVVKRLGGISAQDFPLEAEYLFFQSLPSWAWPMLSSYFILHPRDDTIGSA